MAKAFIEGMKGIPANLEKHFENATNKVIEVMRDPHATFSDYRNAIDYVEQEFKNACQETGTTASNAARDEFEEHVLKGLSKEDLQRWFEHKARAVKDLAEKARETGPKAWRFMSLKVLGAIGVLGGVLTIISGMHRSETDGERMMRRTTRLLDEMTASGKRMDEMQAFVASEDKFNIMTRNLEVVAAEPPEIMPSAVAAVAKQPVAVEVTNASGTHSFTSNIGTVYRSVPQEAQHKIDHDYDHPSVNHHKDFTVNSPVGSAHFKY